MLGTLKFLLHLKPQKFAFPCLQQDSELQSLSLATSVCISGVIRKASALGEAITLVFLEVETLNFILLRAYLIPSSCPKPSL